MQEKKFDTSQLIGFILIGLVLVGYFFYAQKQAEKTQKQAEEKYKQEQALGQTANQSSNQMGNINEDLLDDQVNQLSSDSNDSLAQSVKAPKIESFLLESPSLALKINMRGGTIEEAQLKNWKAYDKNSKSHHKSLDLINKNVDFNIGLNNKPGYTLNTKDLIFFPTEQTSSRLVLTAYPTNDKEKARIQFIYQIKDSLSVDLQIKSTGISNFVNSGSNESGVFTWNQKTLSLEKGISQEKANTEFRYSLNNYTATDYDTNGFTEPKDKIDWIGIKQQFFTTVIESKDGFLNSKGELENMKEEEFVKDFKFSGNIYLKNNEFDSQYTFNFLPLNYDLLKTFKTSVDGKEISKNFQYNINFGWLKWLVVFYLWIYEWLDSYGIAAGWIIFLMTIIVKLVTSPIMYKQYRLSAMMKVLKPELEEINQKFKNADQMAKQREIMALYSKAKVSPFSGCLPALIQLPIFFSLFKFFTTNILLRGKSFLWAEDLTAYDSIFEWHQNIPLLSTIYGNHMSLFVLLYCITMFIYTYMSSSSITQPTQEGMPNMKFIMYLMPVMMVFFLNNVASGLSWYYFVSNLINIFLILIIKNVLIDEKKIHALVQKNKAMSASKPKKKSKWREKMDEIMKQAQAAQAAQQKNKNKK